MPTGARSVRREHVESWMAAQRELVKPASLSLQYRALVRVVAIDPRRSGAAGDRGRTMRAMTGDSPWIRPKAEGLLGRWHMPAGHTRTGVLAACDRMFRDGDELEERSVGMIPAFERCPVCQAVHAATERNRN